MKKRILLFALAAFMVMTSVPISPVSNAAELDEPPSSYVFDFGNVGVEDGCIGVSASDKYDSTKGYGFKNTSMVKNVSASGSGALSDAVEFQGGNGAFKVDLPSGVYNIEVTTGDVESTIINAQGHPQLLFMTGSNAVDSFTIPISDGQLEIYASSGKGSSFSISKLVITQVSDKPTIWACGDSTVASYYNVEDSDTHGWGQYLGDYVDTNTYNLRNISISGIRAHDFAVDRPQYFSTILEYGKTGDILLLSVGINDYSDAKKNGTLEAGSTQYKEDITSLVSHAKNKGMKVYLVKQHGEYGEYSTYPIPWDNCWFSDVIDQVASEQDVKVLDLHRAWLEFSLENMSLDSAKKYYSAGIHLNKAGAQKMAKMVSELLFPKSQTPDTSMNQYDHLFEGTSTIVYETEVSGKPVPNPHKGFVMTVYQPRYFGSDYEYGIGGSKGNKAWDVSTICSGEVKWCDINPQKDVYDFSKIDDMLTECEKHGMTYVIRIKPYSLLLGEYDSYGGPRDFVPAWVYKDGANKIEATTIEDQPKKIEVPVWDDPIYLQACKNLATALANKYDNDPRVEFIDVSTFGNWGEWHFGQAVGSEMPSAKIQKEMLDHFKSVFKNTLLAVPSNVSGEVYQHALDIGIARRDNGMVSIINREWSLRPSYKANVPTIGEYYAPYSFMLDVSDEAGHVNWSEQRFRECIEIPHMTITSFDQGDDCCYQFYNEQKALVDEMVNRVGYNFTVTDARRNGNQLLVKIKNTGVAPCYFDIKLCAEITDAQGNRLSAFGDPIDIKSGTFHDDQEQAFLFTYVGTVDADAIISLAMYDYRHKPTDGSSPGVGKMLNPTVKFDNKNAFSTNRLQLVRLSGGEVGEECEQNGHEFVFDSFVWNEQNYTAKAKYVCSRDDKFVELREALVSSQITKEATCRETGSIIYTATYQEDAGTMQTDTKEVTIPLAAHTFTHWVEEVPATCASQGTKGYKQCTVCGHNFDTNGVEIEDLFIIPDPENHESTQVNYISTGNGTHTKKHACCGAEEETVNCSGGSATCTQKAICDYCNAQYGTVIPHNYSTDWKQDETNHWKECTCGDKDQESAHEPDREAPTENEPQKCKICGYVIAPATGHITHTADTQWRSNETKHWHQCVGCNEVVFDEDVHTGGSATCTKQAICEVCGEGYGELADHVFDQKTVHNGLTLAEHGTCKTNARYFYTCVCGAIGTDTYELENSKDMTLHTSNTFTYTSNGDGTHVKKHACCGAVVETTNCSGGSATCTKKATCDFCDAEYGNLASHTFNQMTLQDATTLVSVGTCISNAKHFYTCECGAIGTEIYELENSKDENNHASEKYKYTSNSNGTHTKKHACCDAEVETTNCSGGTALCTLKAVCDYCKDEYGDLASHVYDSAWRFDKNGHWKECACGEKGQVDAHTPDIEAATTDTPQKCSVCGYIITPVIGHVHEGILVPKVPATAETTGTKAHYKCDGCDELFSDQACTNEISSDDLTIDKLPPTMLSGNNAVVIKEEIDEDDTDVLTFRSSAALIDLVCVKVDDVVLERRHYIAESGSTIIKLRPNYLKTLSEGEHKLTIESKTGSVDAMFVVKAKATTPSNEKTSAPQTDDKPVAPQTDDKLASTREQNNTAQTKAVSPKTGDDSHFYLWITLLLSSGIALIGMVVLRRKKKDSNE